MINGSRKRRGMALTFIAFRAAEDRGNMGKEGGKGRRPGGGGGRHGGIRLRSALQALLP